MKSVIIKDKNNKEVLFHIKALKNGKYNIKVLTSIHDKVIIQIRDDNNKKVLV